MMNSLHERDFSLCNFWPRFYYPHRCHASQFRVSFQLECGKTYGINFRITPPSVVFRACWGSGCHLPGRRQTTSGVRLYGCVPMFSSPNVPQSLCSPVPMLPSSDVPRPYIPWQSLYFPIPFFPEEVYLMFSTIYVPLSLCHPVPMFFNPFRPPVPIFPRSVSHPYVPKIYFPAPMFPGAYIHQAIFFPGPQSWSSWSSTELFRFQCLCSPKMYSSPCAP